LFAVNVSDIISIFIFQQTTLKHSIKTGKLETQVPPAAPLDVAVVWLAHLSRPGEYAQVIGPRQFVNTSP